MAAKKKTVPKKENTGTTPPGHSLRDEAKEELAHFPKIPPTLKGQTPEELIHELRVHQTELEMQAEELRKTHLALEESRDKYLDLYDFAPVGYLTLNDKALITDMNRTGAMLLGVDRNDVINHGLGRFITPESHDDWDRYFVSVRQHEEKQSCTLMLKRGDGSVFPARLESIRISDSSDKTTIIRVAISDITEVCRAEDEIKRSFERFKAVMDGLDALVYVVDMETYDLLFINKYGKDIWGEIEGKTCWKTIQSGQTGPCPFCTNDKLVDSNGNPTGVYRWEFQNTVTGRWYDCRDSAICWVDGRFVRLEIATDITERKQGEEKLKLANRKLALMNDVAYQDIQNKITALRGYAELSKDTKTEVERSAFIAKEEKILADIHQLIKNTKQYQEMGLDQLQWIPAEQEIRLAAALTSLEKTIPIDADLHGLELYTDPIIGRVFFHLIDNAIKHGAGLTRISFSCHETPEGLVLVCEDDGAGIDPSKRATLFSRITGDNARFGLFFVKESLLLSGISYS